MAANPGGTGYTYTYETGGLYATSRTASFEGPIVRRKTTAGRAATPDPLAGNTAQYLNDADETEMALIGYENGHLIALSLGGPDESSNVVPMSSHVNQVTYRAVETEIYDDTGITHMRVTVDYSEDVFVIPVQFNISIKRGAHAADFTHYKTIDMTEQAAQPFAIILDDYWRAATQIIVANLPAEKQPGTPYAFLDALRPQLGLPEPEKTTFFSVKERMMIMYVNALYNAEYGGILMSDLPIELDPFVTLVLRGGRNRPQVDHILPRSYGGSNAFANAQLISAAANNGKKAAVTEAQLQAALADARQMPARAAHYTGSYT